MGILINLVERCDVNRERLLSAPVPSNPEDIFDGPQTAVGALIHLFITKEESARLEEARTDEILDGKAQSGPNDGGPSHASNAGTLLHLLPPILLFQMFDSVFKICSFSY